MIIHDGGGVKRFPSGIKHSFFIEFQKKLKLSSDSEGMYKKAIRKIYTEFNIFIIINKGKRFLLILNILFIINN